jgi:hypothetical protein
MSATDALAVATAVIVAIFVGVLAVALVSVTRTLRVLRASIAELHGELRPVIAELREVARTAGDEVERVDRLVSSAERLEDAVDGASRFAYRTFANPVVKVMAMGTGVSRAAQRLRDGEPPKPAAAPAQPKERRRRARRAS